MLAGKVVIVRIEGFTASSHSSVRRNCLNLTSRFAKTQAIKDLLMNGREENFKLFTENFGKFSRYARQEFHLMTESSA